MGSTPTADLTGPHARPGARRRSVVAIAAVVIAAGLVGCSPLGGTSTPEDTRTPIEPQAPASPAEQPAHDPIGLVNLWRVSAPGEADDTWLRLEAGSYQLWRECGVYTGEWEASGRAFLATEPVSDTAACFGETDDSAAWLQGAATYRSEDDGWVLVDTEGRALAALTVDGAPEPIGAPEDAFAVPPVVDDATRFALAEPPLLPADLRPAERAELLGRWEVEGTAAGSDEGPHVELRPDGTWQGHDGCNWHGGMWAIDEGGRLLVTWGPSSAQECGDDDVPLGIFAATRAGFDGDALVLVGPEGDRLSVFRGPS